MRFDVVGEPGEFASSPEGVLEALAKVAEADGADPDEWMRKAVASVGASAVRVAVTREPRYRAVQDAQEEAVRLYKIAMRMAQQAIEARLERAAQDPAVRDRLRGMARSD